MMTIGELFENCEKTLNEAGIEDARFDVYEIFSAVLGIPARQVILFEDDGCDKHFNDQDVGRILALIARRATGEPIPYITGHAYFYRECYKVFKGALIPRPDTELLVESGLKFLGALSNPCGDLLKLPEMEAIAGGDAIDCLDLCTGSGCVGISFANALASKGIRSSMLLVDKYDDALKCCNENLSQVTNSEISDVKALKADILSENFVKNLEEEGKRPFVILSNPPYITSDEMQELPFEVSNFEPKTALFGGSDGLQFYREIAEKYLDVLLPGGAIIVEHGYLQGAEVRRIFEKYGYTNVLTLKDYGGNDRVTFAQKLKEVED